MASINEISAETATEAEGIVCQIKDQLRAVDKFHEAVNKLLADPQIVTAEHCQHLSKISRVCTKLGQAMDILHSHTIPATVQWLPVDPFHLAKMRVLRSKSPWSFVLTYNSTTPTEFKYEPNHLIKLTSKMPAIGTFLGYLHHGKIIRGILLEVVTEKRVKMLDIDTHDKRLVPISSMYYLPEIMSHAHAQSLHCSILEEDPATEQLWSENLATIFDNALKDCSLSAIILNSVNSNKSAITPKYLVELVGSNELGHVINFSKWLNDRLIPDMKNNQMHQGELISFLEDESLDPVKETDCSNVDRSTVRDMSSISAKTPDWLDFSSSENSSVCSTNLDEPLTSSSFVESVSQDSNVVPQFGAMNAITLPPIGEQVVVKIKHMNSTLSFYVALEDQYSGVLKDGVLETHRKLISRMNTPSHVQKYAPLTSAPMFGQLLAFRAKFSGKWTRGVVSLVSDGTVSLHDPDSGRLEIRPVEDLRLLPEEDAVLPYQAVETFLHEVRVIAGMEQKAKHYFIHLTKAGNTQISIRQHLPGNKISVDLFSEGLHVNQALVSSGYFNKFDHI